MKRTRINPMVYAALYLSKKSASDKVVLGNRLVVAMTGNISFNTPQPSLEAVQTATDELEESIVAAQSGRPEDRQTMYEKEDAFDSIVTRLKEYAENVANATPDTAKAILTSGGFELAKAHTPTPAPTPVTNVNAGFTNEQGEIEVSWKSVKYGRFYEVYINTVTGENTGWTLKGSTSKKTLIISGLQSGTRYYFRIISVGNNGSSGPSAIATCIAS